MRYLLIRYHGLRGGHLRLPCSKLQAAHRVCQLRRTTTSANGPDIERTRNIGIIAHIDAGKTTTTERMLYYSGHTRRIGDVDDGSTVTDFLPAERARGITIQSAAVTFHWPPLPEGAQKFKQVNAQPHQISHIVNLIDTPGHADFTFEVLRSLRILDGAVCVLDGVAGVEAQTEKVWFQANRYSIPRIVFVNKLDRDGAAFGRTVKEVGSRLKGMPAVCQIPWWEGGKGKFTGVGDVINLCALKWEEDGDGKAIQHYNLSRLGDVDTALAEEIKKARVALVEALCDFDEKLLEAWMDKDDDSLALSAEEIWASLRRCVLDGTGRLIPIFAGASFRNIGVQPLLDAINNLLPSPIERPAAEVSLNEVEGSLADLLAGKLQVSPSKPMRQVGKKQNQQTSLVSNIEGCALAFKVVNDPRRGVLVYIRVYSGSIKRGAVLWNTNLNVAERANRLLQMYASDSVEIADIPAGQIGVIAGLKYTRTGDTLVSTPNFNPKTGPPGKISSLQLRPIDVPPPVFFAAIEPHSLSEEKNVADILALLLREDPSLHVNVDEESGQMHLSGMGELHLEIARDRLVNDFKAKATMGNIEIGYRECILSASPPAHIIFEKEIAGRKGRAGCTTIISSLDDSFRKAESIERDGNVITVTVVTTSADISEEEDKPLPVELPYHVLRDAMVNGAVAALARGPRRAFPIHNCHVQLTFNTHTDLFGADTTPAALSSAARSAVQRRLTTLHATSQIGLMEPVMNVVISCDEASLGSIVHDISSARGGQVLSLGDDNAKEEVESELKPIDPQRIYAPPDPFASSDSMGGDGSGHGQQRHITARVPLKEMVGYLKQLRSLTGGRGTFVMSVDRFERLSGPREKALG